MDKAFTMRESVENASYYGNLLLDNKAIGSSGYEALQQGFGLSKNMIDSLMASDRGRDILRKTFEQRSADVQRAIGESLVGQLPENLRNAIKTGTWDAAGIQEKAVELGHSA